MRRLSQDPANFRRRERNSAKREYQFFKACIRLARTFRSMPLEEDKQTAQRYVEIALVSRRLFKSYRRSGTAPSRRRPS